MAPPADERAGADPLLPQFAVCDRHFDRAAVHLVEAPDGRGDSYLCRDCFRGFAKGRPLPVLRHSPSIRRRRALEPSQRRQSREPGRRRSAAGQSKRLESLFAFADVSVVLIDDTGKILAAVGQPGGVLGHLGRQRVGILDFIHPEDLSLAYAKLDEVLEEPGRDSSFRIRAMHSDGSVRTQKSVPLILSAVEITLAFLPAPTVRSIVRVLPAL